MSRRVTVNPCDMMSSRADQHSQHSNGLETLTNVCQQPRIPPLIRGFHASSACYLSSGVPKLVFLHSPGVSRPILEIVSTFEPRGTGTDCDCVGAVLNAFLLLCLGRFVMVRKYETYTFSSAKFFADRGSEGVAQPLTERVNVSPTCIMHCDGQALL